MTKDAAAALAQAALTGAHIYEDYVEPGANPGAGRPYVSPAELRYARPLERNVVVGPMVVSTCLCPQCGQVYVRGELLGPGGYTPAMTDDEPDPPCWRCEVAVGVPLDPEEAAAMAEFRWRYDQFLAATEVGGMTSQDEMRAALVRAHDSAWVHAPALLRALERRYGNQQDAGVQAIASGAAGVVVE